MAPGAPLSKAEEAPHIYIHTHAYMHTHIHIHKHTYIIHIYVKAKEIVQRLAHKLGMHRILGMIPGIEWSRLILQLWA